MKSPPFCAIINLLDYDTWKGAFFMGRKIPQKYKYRSAGACRCRKDHTVGGTVICHRADPCAGACGSSGCISGYGCAGAGAWNNNFFQAGAASAANDE